MSSEIIDDVKENKAVMVKTNFECDICDSTFQNKTKMNDHKRHVHSEKKTYQMGSDLRTRKKGKVKCDVCDKLFQSYESLSVHEQQVHGLKEKLKCKICEKTFTAEHMLKLHVLRTHDSMMKTMNCDICEMKLGSNLELSVHIANMHKKIKKVAQYCKKCNCKIVNMEDHLKRMHPEKDDLVNCQKCGKSMSKPSLNLHMRRVHQPMKCPHCDKMLKKGKYYLREHILQVHEKVKSHKCNVCQNSFSTSVSLKTHILSIHDKVKFNCNQCSKSFSLLGNLHRHKRTIHAKHKPICNQ